MKELYADRSSIWRWKKYSICKSKNYLQIKELFAHQNVICRLKSYLQIEKLFAEQQIIYRLKKYLTCRSKNYLQIKKLSVDQGNACRSKKYFICSSKNYSICKSKNYQQTKQLSTLSRNYVLIKAPAADWRIIFQSDWRTICRLKALSADQRIIFCRLKISTWKKYLICQSNICRLKNYYLRIKFQAETWF